MTTLALYIAFLIAKDDYVMHDLVKVVADFAEIEAFNAFVAKAASPINADAIAHLKAGNKIRAIKEVRQVLMDTGRDYSLRASKDLIDKYIEDNPEVYPHSTPTY